MSRPEYRKYFDTLSTGQMAKICQVAPRTISKWTDAGRIPGSYRLPGSDDRRIPRASAIRFLCSAGMEHCLSALEQLLPVPRLLVLSADPATQLALGTHPWFAEHGWHVAHAYDGFSAGCVMQASPCRAVLIDLGMGWTEGLSIAARIRQTMPEVMLLGLVPEDRLLSEVLDLFDDAWQLPCDLMGVAKALEGER